MIYYVLVFVVGVGLGAAAMRWFCLIGIEALMRDGQLLPGKGFVDK